MSRLHIPILVAACLLTAALPSRALLGFGKDDEGEREERGSRRYVLRVPDRKAEKDLLDLLGARKRILEDMVVLRRLVAEKKGELDQFRRGLVGLFGFRPDGSYDYDPATRTLYEVTRSASNAPPEKTKMKELRSDEEARQLLRLLAGQRVALEEVRVFEAVAREKAAELERVERVLSGRFSMVRGRNYEYDPKTMRLFDVTPAPSNAPPALQAQAPRPKAPAQGPGPAIPLRMDVPAATNAPAEPRADLPPPQIEVPVAVPMW